MATLRHFTLSCACLLALASNGAVMAAEAPPSGQTVRLGTGTVDDECKAVSFTPVPVPVSFPSGTSEIAYRVDALRGRNVDDVSAKVNIACGAGEVNHRRCGTWDVVAGEALLTSFTVVVSCGQPGRPAPFAAGSYKLEVSKGGVPVETLEFTVKK